MNAQLQTLADISRKYGPSYSRLNSVALVRRVLPAAEVGGRRLFDESQVEYLLGEIARIDASRAARPVVFRS